VAIEAATEEEPCEVETAFRAATVNAPTKQHSNIHTTFKDFSSEVSPYLRRFNSQMKIAGKFTRKYFFVLGGAKEKR
jgi:hypothetical protein